MNVNYKIFQSANKALEASENSQERAAVSKKYVDLILKETKRSFGNGLWPKEYKEHVRQFLIEVFSSDFIKIPSYSQLCGLYLKQTSLLLKSKWEKIFDYRLNKKTLTLKIFKKTFHFKLTPIRCFFVRHLLHFKNDVDLVYLWCDGSDQKWQKKRLAVLKKTNPNWTLNGQNKCRFIDNDELKYSLASVQMYAPWIRNIYIVTDGQKPKWLDTSNKKIKIIDHKEIIAEEYLPTFNSNVIDSAIHHIKGLSEYFLFSNDDTFFYQPVTKDFFFSADGKPYARLHKMPSIFKVVESPYLQTLVYMSKIYQKKGGNTCLLNPHHNIDAYTKTMLQHTEKTFEKEYKKWRKNRFRTNHDFQRVLAYYQAIDEKNAILKIQPSVPCPNVDSMFFRLNDKDIEACLKVYRPKLFCVNDNEKATDTDREKIKKFYQKLFSCKSNFEK